MKAFNDRKHYETPYVVKVHNAYQMAEAQPVFFFAHPAPGADGGADGGAAGGAAGGGGGVHSNARHKRLVFETPLGGALHGFIGYFHSTLCALDLGGDRGDDLGGDLGDDLGGDLGDDLGGYRGVYVSVA